MGTVGKTIIGVNVKELIKFLNKAYADEWLAYYQYWVGAKVAQGLLRGPVAAELEEHASDELKHAGMLTERILQLGGKPLIDPKDWHKETNCGYDKPSSSNLSKSISLRRD